MAVVGGVAVAVVVVVDLVDVVVGAVEVVHLVAALDIPRNKATKAI